MVIYSEYAQIEFENILHGLVTWKKHPLEFEHAKDYVRDIRKAADDICTKTAHKNCTYQTHKKYGEKVFTYRRKKNTQWYVIYDWDKDSHVAYVNKIINNYMTVSGLR